MHERRPLYPIPDFADRASYQYITQADVSRMLAEFGLGPSKRMVHAAYVSPDRKTIVGVLRITQDKDHLVDYPIFQGVLGPEAMAQTWIVLKTFTGELTPDKTARFEDIEGIHFRHSIYPPVVVNIVVREMPERNAAYGQIILGELPASRSQPAIEGLFHASIMNKEGARANGEKRKRIQFASEILFPIQE